MSRLRTLVSRLLAAASLLAAALPALSSPAYTISNNTGLQLANPPFTLGFEFATNSAMTVTALGIFDDSQDGLVERHEIGIWDAGGTLLASTFIGAGTSAPLLNQFRYVGIAPIALSSGATYHIGALYSSGSDALLFPGDTTGFATDPRITFASSAFVSGGTLANPTSSAGTSPAYFGPNFVIAAAVPEPGTLALLGFGLAGLAATRRRKQ